MTEVFEIMYGWTQPTKRHENTHNTRNFQIISNENKKTVTCSQETIQFRTPVGYAKLSKQI